MGIRVVLLTGSMTGKQKREAREAIASGEADLAVGTHALISDSTEFQNLGLVITDEQHRFGVGQRSKLSAKGEAAPSAGHVGNAHPQDPGPSDVWRPGGFGAG